MGHKPDRGQDTRQEATMVGWLAHRGDWVACPEVHSGPALVDVVLGPLLSKFHDFRC